MSSHGAARNLSHIADDADEVPGLALEHPCLVRPRPPRDHVAAGNPGYR